MTDVPRAPSDQPARDRAARSFDENLLVVAGAGSGKTTLLIERLLNLRLGRDLKLSRVAALTFTEKAAAEMRDRLVSQLSEVVLAVRAAGGSRAAVLEALEAAGPPARSARRSVELVTGPDLRIPVDEVGRRALAGLDQVDSGTIGTIHAACADLLRRHPRAARLDPGYRIDTGAALERAFEEEWAAFLAKELGGNAPRPELWRRVLEAQDVAAAREVARTLVLRGGEPAPVDAASALEALRAEAEALIGRLPEARAAGANRNLPAYWDDVESVLRALSDRGVDEAVRVAEATGRDFEKKPVAGKGAADPALVEDVRDAARFLLRHLADVDEPLVRDLIEAAAPVLELVRERCERDGLVSFQRLLVAARDLLRDHPGVLAAERDRLDALLLDEFQDTDPLQYEIAFLLGAREGLARPGADPWDVPLEPGRLFLVGDPKQSIYRFRGADMAAYDRAVRKLEREGGAVLALTANFRSRAEVLGPVNALGRHAIVEDRPYQPGYAAVEPGRADATAGEPRVAAWTVEADGTGACARRLAEARAIGRRLGEWRADGTLPDYGQVAVLLRAMTDVALYQRGLSEAGVPFVTEGGKSFAQREEVVQALALLRCLAQPNDPAALLSVLRSPSGGCDDAELAALGRLVREQPGVAWSYRTHAAIPEDARAAVPRALRTLEGLDALSRRVARLPADDALRAVLAGPRPGEEGAAAWRPRLIELHAAAHEGAQRVANLGKLVARAADLSRRDGLSLLGVVEQLERELVTGDPQGDSPLADESVDAVRIMSIHQAKGLEFDVVILPDVARGTGGRDRGRATRVGSGSAGLSVVLPDGRRNAASILVEREARRHEEAELGRLLYVATTRARERLVVVNGDPAPRSSTWPFPTLREAWGYDPAVAAGTAFLEGSVLHEVLSGKAPEPPREGRDPIAELAAAVAAHDRARERLAAAAVGRPASATGDREALRDLLLEDEDVPPDAGVAEATDVFAPVEAEPAPPGREPRAAVAGDAARAVGVAVHRALELGDLADLEQVAALACRAAIPAAAEAGRDPDAVAAEAEALVRGLAGTELLQRVLAFRLLARELPFVMRHGGRAWHGLVDAVLEDDDGGTWVLDWKTDREHHPERHRDQLALYGEAVRRWRSLPGRPGLALGLVATGRWHVLEPPG